MIPLPKYVHAPKNSSGRRYYFYEKYRGTARAWPRVILPTDPMSEEFARRIALLDRLEASNASGDWKWIFRDATDRRHDLPAPADAAAFWSAVDKAEVIGKKLAAGERKTFSALIVEFKDSAAFKVRPDGVPKRKGNGLSQSTHDQYKRHLDDIEKAWGDDPVADLTTFEAQKAIDAFADTPAAGRVFRATLSRLIGWSIPRGYTHHNPVENTEKSPEGGTYDPWEPWMFEHFFKHARIGLHLAVYSGLFTGQRKVDVLKMRRPLEGVREMPLIAQKTGEIVPVQIHSEYREIIRASKPVPRFDKDGQQLPDSEMLHLREDGEPWTYEGFNTAWQREMDRDEFKCFRERRVVFHGTRKNAVNNLLEVGCSEALVGAIVRMSPAMVHHYSKKVNQFRLARAAMKKLEDGWDEQRKSVLGNVVRLG